VVFVFTDFWKDSATKLEHEIDYDGPSYGDRLWFVLVNAGKASFATSLTTALSFFVNLVSVLRPLREFGFFMGFCVMLVWLLVLSIYAPLCIVDEKWFSCCNWQQTSAWSKTDRMTSWRASTLGAWAKLLRPVRWICLLGSILLAIAALIAGLVAARLDSGMPSLFPSDHNRNRGQKVFSTFPPLAKLMDVDYIPPTTSLNVCDVDTHFSNATKCLLSWCNVGTDPIPYGTARKAKPVAEGLCQCFRRGSTSRPAGCGTISASHRFLGADGITSDALVGKLKQYIKKENAAFDAIQTQFKTLAPVVLQDWEMGDVMFKNAAEVRSKNYLSNTTSDCSWETICFCGNYVCQLDGSWSQAEQFSLKPSLRRLAPSTPLGLGVLPANLQTNVKVVFGIKIDTGTPLIGEKDVDKLWSFDPEFDLSQPWAQRRLHLFCSKLPASLKIVKKLCLISGFRDWLVHRGEMFPATSKRFNSLMDTYLYSGATLGSTLAKDYAWLTTDKKVRAVFVTIGVDFNKKSPTAPAAQYKTHWDNYVREWNSQFIPSAGEAWHTCSLWVRAAAQQELVQSTALTLGLVVVGAFGSMVVFTFDMRLACFVVLSTASVIAELTFFMLVIMGWAFGPIEVIALIVFLGYALDYSLHIAYKYSSPHGLASVETDLEGSLLGASENRSARTTFALKSIGGAALGSAVTTMGCSVFLMCCTLTIFRKMGSVVLAVTLMSIFAAFCPLTSALLIAGPLHPEENWERAKEWRDRIVYSVTSWHRVAVSKQFNARQVVRHLSDRIQDRSKAEDCIVLATSPINGGGVASSVDKSSESPPHDVPELTLPPPRKVRENCATGKSIEVQDGLPCTPDCANADHQGPVVKDGTRPTTPSSASHPSSHSSPPIKESMLPLSWSTQSSPQDEAPLFCQDLLLQSTERGVSRIGVSQIRARSRRSPPPSPGVLPLVPPRSPHAHMTSNSSYDAQSPSTSPYPHRDFAFATFSSDAYDDDDSREGDGRWRNEV
jgi:hypothetical protein